MCYELYENRILGRDLAFESVAGYLSARIGVEEGCEGQMLKVEKGLNSLNELIWGFKLSEMEVSSSIMDSFIGSGFSVETLVSSESLRCLSEG